MESETLLPCDGVDIEKLLVAQRAVRRKLVMYALGFGMTAYLWWSLPVLPLRVILGVLALMQVLSLLLLYSRYSDFSRDLGGGCKLAQPGAVEHKERFDTEGVKLDPTRPVFFLRVNGQEVGVGEDDYQQFNEGDAVNLFISPHARHILGVAPPAN